MNRPGAMPQTVRGMPAGFGGQQQQQQQQQQQPQQPGRAGSNRLPNGKIANNAGGWAFGGNVPMGGATSNLQNSSRQLGGGLSFAQSLGASQPATPLDLSEFPSLSNNSQLASGNPSALWAGASRPMGGAISRNQPTPHTQQSQQDDFFSSSRMNTSQAAFRFGNQAGMSQSSQPQPSSIDDFPPLNNSLRNGEGEIGQERTSNLMSTLGFGAQGNSAGGPLQGAGAGNGLLNALSANSRTSDVHSPEGAASIDLSRSQELRSSNDEPRQKPPGFRDDVLPSQMSKEATLSSESRNPLGAIGSSEAQSIKGKDNEDVQPPTSRDPLAGMAEIDKWGIKGLRTLMNNYPDYAACVGGMDPSAFGFDLTSPERISTQIWSPFNDAPPRPAIPDFRLPDCYKVNNVQPLRNKISNFNEETLMWIFYSCPGDYQQHLAAEQLFQRQWRWHKKLKFWLTKDEIMHPRILSTQHEEGYYVVWNTDDWRKERRQLTLHYADLETNPNTGM
ncbi:hypothetical protein F4808DRAFT_412776 [Astrocystis sublimbata]|nr:hypothetical protein F4808DRAFT_412776 [Astrocystis sublimbata]